MRLGKVALGTFLFSLFFSAAWGKIDTVEVQDFSFVPNSLTIKAGDTVLWRVTVECCIAHTTTRASSPMTWNSGPLALNATFRLPFPNTGTFSYFCSPHQGLGMTGSITVLPPPPPVSVSATGWLGLFLLGASLTAAGSWILERRRKTG